MFTEIFKAIFFTSLIGTVLAAVLMLVKLITKKYFSSGWHYYMWLVVLLVMVLPVRFNLPERAQPVQNKETVSKASDMPTYQIVWRHIETSEIVSKNKIQEANNSIEDLKNFVESKIDIISFAWFAIAVLLLSAKVSGYILFRCRIMRNSENFSCPELKNFTKRKVIVRKSSITRSPIMMGIFKPVLVLPDVLLTSEQLDNILAHEMTHFRRNDILYKWFVAFVKCIHWFNPMTYFVSRQVNIWCEISCDLAVVEQMNKEEEISYINTILALLSTGKSKNIPLTTGMLGSKEALKRRFLMIKNKNSIRGKAKLVSGVVAAAVLVSTIGVSGVVAGNMFDSGDTIVGKANGKVAAEADSDNTEPDVVYEADNATGIEVELPKMQENEEHSGEYSYIYIEDAITSEIAEDEEPKIVWPCPSSNRIIATFNTRVHPVTGEEIKHDGIDIRAEVGEDVVAAIGGKVTKAGWDASNGKTVVISKGNVEILYAHLSKINVEVGDIVTAGQVVAKSGNTGKSVGPHLHFELIIDGENVDPQLYQ